MFPTSNQNPVISMKTNIITNDFYTDKTVNTSWLSGLARKVIINRLGRIKSGQIILHDNDRHWKLGKESANLTVNLYVHDVRFYTRLMLNGSIGGGEAYILGYWNCDNLTNLIRILALNRHAMLKIEGGLAAFSGWLIKIFHKFNQNTLTGSRRNIQAHYDIGNDLFKLFLDDSMMYSSAIYPRQDATLEEASIHKIDLICKRLKLKPEDHLLEIGTGWGSLAVHAAKHYGCQVTSTTISNEQYSVARERVKKEKLEHKVTIIKQDYRKLTGQYEKLVSVEMLEAVGHKYFDTFFKKCSSLLRSDGLMLLQTITIAEQNYEYARSSVDFIQRYIFPGGCLPSLNVVMDCIARVTDFRMLHAVDFGEHYARTLQEWRSRFSLNLDKVKKLGYPDSFIRMWEYYLCYCEGGFMEQVIGVSHLLFAKPLNRDAVLVPTS